MKTLRYLNHPVVFFSHNKMDTDDYRISGDEQDDQDDQEDVYNEKIDLKEIEEVNDEDELVDRQANCASESRSETPTRNRYFVIHLTHKINSNLNC